MHQFNPFPTLRWLALGAAVPGFLAAGCGDVPDPKAGVLVVPYELGNQKQCESLGITRVRAELDDGYLLEEVDCSAGQLRFNNLEAGAYQIRVYGLDADGYPAMDNVESGKRVLRVRDDGNTVVADPPIVLSAAPATLQLRWDLGFGNCDSAAIERFEVQAWRVDGSQLLLEETVSCEASGDGTEQYRTLPDADRRLGGEELGEVSIQPYDANGYPIGEPVSFSFDAPGAGREVKLSMMCDSGGCVGNGSPD